MISKILFGGYIAFILIFSNPSVAQDLDLDSFVRSILKNNPGVQRILLEEDIAAGAMEASFGVDDAMLGSSVGLSHAEPNQLLGFEASSSNDAQLGLSYNRLFSASGTRLSLSYANQYTDRNPALNSIGGEYYQPSFTVGLIQPLLKNAKGIQDRLNIKTSKLNFEIARLSSKENLESYITQLAALYIDWYLASQELAISKEVYHQVLEQEKLTRLKVERQVIEEYELLRVQETREDYYSRWQQAKGRFAGLTHQIRYQMNQNSDSPISKIAPLNPKKARLLAVEQHSIRKEDYLTTKSRLRNILTALEQQQILLLDAKDNSRKSDLNLNLGYISHGVDGEFGGAHTSSMDRNDYSIMLEYKYPLGNRKAKGDYKSQLANKRKIEADTKQRLIDSESNLANLQAQASQLTIAVESNDRKISFATKKLKQERHLFEIGKLDLFELLRDQSTQLESRLNRERLYTQLLTLKLHIGELLDQNLDVYKVIKSTISNSASEEIVQNE